MTAQAEYVLFPRADYSDGIFTKRELDNLEKKCELWYKTNPYHAKMCIDTMCQVHPREYYEGAINVLDNVIRLFLKDFIAQKDISYENLCMKVLQIQEELLMMIAVMKTRESVFEGI